MGGYCTAASLSLLMEQDGRALRMVSISGKSSKAVGTHSLLYVCLGVLNPAVRAEACPQFWAFSPPVGLPTPTGLLRAMTWHLSGPLSSHRHWRRSRLLHLLRLTDPVLKICILFSNQWWVQRSRHHVSVQLTSWRGVSGFLDDLVSRLAGKGHPWISPGKGEEIRVYRRRQ